MVRSDGGRLFQTSGPQTANASLLIVLPRHVSSRDIPLHSHNHIHQWIFLPFVTLTSSDPNDVRRNNPVSLIICTSLHCNASFCRGIKASWRTFVISLALPARSSSDSYYQNTFSPVNNIWTVMIICRRRRKIIRAVRCCIAFGLSYKHSVFFSSLQYIMSRERMIESDSETCQAPSNTEPRSWRCQQINFRWQHVKQWCSRSEYGFRFSACR